jgi:hypothetical protein
MTKTYYPHKLAEYITIVLIFAIAYPIFYYHFEILRAWIGMRVEVNYYTYLYYIIRIYYDSYFHNWWMDYVESSHKKFKNTKSS